MPPYEATWAAASFLCFLAIAPVNLVVEHLVSIDAGAMNLPSDILKQCWFLAGPTAVGKSDVGVELARRIDAEVVSLDSMSLYRGMDVGTAKPSRGSFAASCRTT